MKEIVLLVDIDAILDTRLATYIDMGKTEDEILSLGYVNRLYDRLFDDYDDYVEAYKNRDMNTLFNAKPTLNIDYISGRINHSTGTAVVTPNTMLPTILLNTHPYDISEKETQVITDALYEYIGNRELTIGTVHYSKKELTPGKLKDLSVNNWYTYKGEDWINHHVKLGASDPKCPLVKMHTPFLICEEVDDILETITTLGEDGAIGEKAELLVSPYIGLEYCMADRLSISGTDVNIYPWYM